MDGFLATHGGQKWEFATLQTALELGSFYRSSLLREIVGPDDVLYRAHRDFIKPSLHTSGNWWRFDEVEWAGPTLPTGELKRSIGHWNPAGQSEAFFVVGGIVYIVVALKPEFRTFVVRCEAGQYILLPQGSWHLTFVVTRTATVHNCYLDAGHRDLSEAKYAAGEDVGLSIIRSHDRKGLAVVNRTDISRPVVHSAALPVSGLVIDDIKHLAESVDRMPHELTVEWLREETLLPGGRAILS